jgi:hypothetical protein
MLWHGINWLAQAWQEKTGLERLVMTILCRNEVDIIETNIRTHANLGVDAFVVMDNGSTDGTREKLADLTKSFDLSIIDQPEQSYQQAKWMLQLAHNARKNQGAQWVISNDADEFWLPETGSLKDHLLMKDSVVTIPRSNMILDESALTDHYQFTQARWRVNYPICYNKQAQLGDASLSMLLAPISPKVIVNPSGLIKLSGGNHRAKHWFKLATKRTTDAIRVYHFPIRSWQQFEQNIIQRKKLLSQGVRMGDHYRRWVSCLEQGTLRDEFEKLVIHQKELASLARFGILVEDERPSQTLSIDHIQH